MSHCEACKNSGGAENGCPGCGHEAELERLKQERDTALNVLKHCKDQTEELLKLRAVAEAAKPFSCPQIDSGNSTDAFFRMALHDALAAWEKRR